MLFAAEGGGSVAFDSPLTWINFGVLGLLVFGLLTGWIWAKPSADRMTEERDRILDERDRALAQRDAMAEVLQERLLPVVSEFITTTKALLPILQGVQRLQQIVPALQDFVDKADSGGEDRGRRSE